MAQFKDTTRYIHQKCGLFLITRSLHLQELKVEAWHRRLETLIARSHVGIFSMIKQIQKEQNEVEIEIEKSIRGEPAPKKRKEDEQRESRLQHVIANRTRTAQLFFAVTALSCYSEKELSCSGPNC